MAGAGLLLASFMVWYFSTIVVYILISAALSFLGGPLVILLQRIEIKRWKMPRWGAALITLILLLAIFLAGMWLFVPPVVEKINYLANIDTNQLGENLSDLSADINQWFEQKMPYTNITVQSLYNDYIAPYFNNSTLGSLLGGFASMIIALVAAIFSISFITYFFLKEDKLFSEGMVTLFPKRYEDNVHRAINSSMSLLGRYFIGICAESLIKFLVVCFALYFLGMEFSMAMIVGLVTGVLNVIPYLGPIVGWGISVVLVAVSADATGSIGGTIVEMSVVLGVFQLLDNIVLQPYIYSSSVRAHPLEIFIVILMAGYIGGIIGMLVAIPCYTVMRVFAKEFFARLRVVQRLTENL